LRVAFITNFCPHYRVKTFDRLSRHGDFDFYFFSEGEEWYWQRERGIRTGDFNCIYLPGFRVGGTRITPTLPQLLMSNDYGVFVKCINGRFALPITYLIARLRGRPFVLWTGVWTRLQTTFHRLTFPLTRFIYRHSDAIVVYGSHVRRFLVAEGVEGNRIFIAPHAIDNMSFRRPVGDQVMRDLQRKLETDQSRAVILYVGRLESSKGIEYLLEAFKIASLDDWVLLIVGSGSRRQELARSTRRLGIEERVRFAGYVQPDRIHQYYALASMLVLPSVTTPAGKEPWGLVVNEAFNYGIPVIASDAVGAAAGGLLRDGVNGLVVPERDAVSLAGAIQLLAKDEALRSTLGERARDMVSDWDTEGMVQGFNGAIRYVTEG
jgi:glycosyltransferase involved in cell wall biosynthesis